MLNVVHRTHQAGGILLEEEEILQANQWAAFVVFLIALVQGVTIILQRNK